MPPFPIRTGGTVYCVGFPPPISQFSAIFAVCFITRVGPSPLPHFPLGHPAPFCKLIRIEQAGGWSSPPFPQTDRDKEGMQDRDREINLKNIS